VDAFGVLDEVLGDYENFVKGFLEIKDDQIRTKVEKEIADGLLWPEPWLALNPAFESGGTVTELVDRQVLHPEAVSVFRARTEQDPFGREIAFHRHQTDALEIANRRESYVLTTGTGSGKSMAYIVPIVDRVLREGSGKGVRAIIVYPMNALANSQRNELEKFLGKTTCAIDFGQSKPVSNGNTQGSRQGGGGPAAVFRGALTASVSLIQFTDRARIAASCRSPGLAFCPGLKRRD
jgi:ATP-dependent helicase YprA (DUF1998 family)